jgi:hypothetical protein
MSATTTSPRHTHAPARSAAPDHPTRGEAFDEAAPAIGAPAIYGPPVAFVLGPWLILVLLLIPPAALLITIGLVVAVAAALPVAIGALVASPFLLVRHLHARQSADRRRTASARRPARQPRARLAHVTTR